MACAGCQRRRKKIAAAYHAVKHGLRVAKQTYITQTSEPERELGGRYAHRIPKDINIIDIRQ
jgi:hypothetical protein